MNTPSLSHISVAAYYYPCTHPHPRWNKAKYPGFTEWDLVRSTRPRFPGQLQPKVPLWGYEDESDPLVMARKIDAAADHGLEAFIFDWYHYNDGPYLEGALDRGFLQAANNDRLRFAIMWANHDWYDIQGYTPADPCKLLYPGAVNEATWETITDRMVEKYFAHPSYWKIEGKPYFSIYDMSVFLDSFGSVESARRGLDRFRAKVEAAGHPGLHLNAILWGQPNLPGSRTPTDWPRICEDLALDSLTGYTWVHHGALNEETFPTSDYNWGRDRYLEFLDHALSGYPVPYFPNTTVHWDNSPRAHPTAAWDKPADHVVNPVMTGNTPAAFKEASRMIAERLLAVRTPQPRILTVNAWNEWPEGSCLEPEQQYGFGYLQALRELFSTTHETRHASKALRASAAPLEWPAQTQ